MAAGTLQAHSPPFSYAPAICWWPPPHRCYSRPQPSPPCTSRQPNSLEAVGRAVATLALEPPPALLGEHAVGDVRAHVRRALRRQQLLALDERAACGRGRKDAAREMQKLAGLLDALGQHIGPAFPTAQRGRRTVHKQIGQESIEHAPDCTRSSTMTTCRPRAVPSFSRTMRLSPSRTLVQMTCAAQEGCQPAGSVETTLTQATQNNLGADDLQTGQRFHGKSADAAPLSRTLR